MSIAALPTSPRRARVVAAGRASRVLRRYLSGKILAGFGILVGFALLGTIGPALLAGSPTAPTGASLMPPSGAHWLGTTLQGQDVLTQLVDGTASSLTVGFVAGALATAVSVVVGLWAGYVRGLGGELFSGFSNVFLVIPSLPLVIVLAGYLPRTGALSIMIVIAVTTWAGGARIMRAQTLAMVERDYVRSARAIGEPVRRILLAEVLPNLSTIVMSTFLFAVIGAIATEAGLAFLGLGNVEQVSWGYMINLAQSNDAVLGGAWWWWVPPGVCYALVGAALGLINFGIDEIGNPRLRMVKVAARARRQTQGGDSAASPPEQDAIDRGSLGAGPAGGQTAAGGEQPRGPRAGEPLLEVRDLRVGYWSERGLAVAVQEVSFTLRRGEIMGIAGESGSGKSTVAYAITRLIHPPGQMLGGTILFHRAGSSGNGAAGGTGPVDILAMDPEELRKFRWERLAIVFQSAMNALNPVLPISAQLIDAIRAHRPQVRPAAAAVRAGELLALVGVPAERAASFPHELSGGMRQRVIIAMAMALEPDLVVLDEPTTGLDVVVQRGILETLSDLRDRLGFSVIFITHDLSLLLEVCDSVMVMYGGRAVEIGSAPQVHRGPLHPYSQGLRDAFPPLQGAGVRLHGIPGLPPDPGSPVPGCAFHPRCPHVFAPCHDIVPAPLPVGTRMVRCHLHDDRFARSPASAPPAGETRPPGPDGPDGPAGTAGRGEAAVVLRGEHLHKRFRLQQGRRRTVRAVDDVTVEVRRGQVTAVVGESGSGKSTLLRLMALLEPATAGTIALNDRPVPTGRIRRRLAYRSEVQLIFQDPFASLNPARTVGYQLERALRLHGDRMGAQERRDEVGRLLERVSLAPASRFAGSYPHELSGGQRQRVAFARALAVRPSVLLADEPVSMLDVSMQVDVLNLLDDLRCQEHLGILYITHNIASARYLADALNVMYAGMLVEGGPPRAVTENPVHPYTQILMAAAPDPDRRAGRAGPGRDGREPAAFREPPDMAGQAGGCPFHPSCPFATGQCRTQMPPVISLDSSHWARCWLLAGDQAAATDVAPSRPAEVADHD
ncbi:MAG: dipeptide ABC transporter ATP-binding protein [Streptosporangiaceae bacterium]